MERSSFQANVLTACDTWHGGGVQLWLDNGDGADICLVARIAEGTFLSEVVADIRNWLHLNLHCLIFARHRPAVPPHSDPLAHIEASLIDR